MNFCTLTTVINGRELKYDLETNAIWCIDGRTKKWQAKSATRDGEYLRMRIGNKKYKYHRIIYKFYNPDWDIEDGSQDNSIDHINGTKNDNRIVNLRNVTNQQNNWNQTKSNGCIWVERTKKWRARIRVSGKLIHLGYYDLKEDARNAYLEAKKIHHIINPILCTGS